MQTWDVCGGEDATHEALCADDELISFKDEGHPLKEDKLPAGRRTTAEEGDLAEIKSSLVNETERSCSGTGNVLPVSAPLFPTGEETRAQMCAFPHAGRTDGTLRHCSSGKLWDGYEGCQPYPIMHYTGFLMLPSDSYRPPTAATAPVGVSPLMAYRGQEQSYGLPHSTAAVTQSLSSADVFALYSVNGAGGPAPLHSPLGWFSQHAVAGVATSHGDGTGHTPWGVGHTPQGRVGETPLSAGSSQRRHVKKPLNAFMLFMRETRARAAAESSLTDSSSVNQVLGKKWRALPQEEQAKYYELARREKSLHKQLYPGWSARENYGKRKKRKQEKVVESVKGNACS